MINWEQIDNYTKRTRIPGIGWLVVHQEDVLTEFHKSRERGYEWRPAMCFVPDPSRSWYVREDKKERDVSNS